MHRDYYNRTYLNCVIDGIMSDVTMHIYEDEIRDIVSQLSVKKNR